jgi:hypothetical protein
MWAKVFKDVLDFFKEVDGLLEKPAFLLGGQNSLEKIE